jgi:hypothetical protein
MAVFTFDTIATGSDVTLKAEGPRPVALLSQDPVHMTGGSASASGINTSAGPSGGGGSLLHGHAVTLGSADQLLAHGGGGGRIAVLTCAGSFTNDGSISVAGGLGGFGAGAGSPGVVSSGTSCAPTPTASLTTAIHTPQHIDMTGQTLIAPLMIHDKATVMTTVNAIPAGSRVTFRQFLK